MLQRLMFGLMYRIGFTPWEGHALPARLRRLAEAPAPPGGRRALDLGCGTGYTSIYLSRLGWDVTAVDFVEAALRKARAKARASGATVRWIRGDVTTLGTYGLTPGFDLIVDSGCLHGLPEEARSAYAREVTAVAGRDGSLIILGFAENPRRRGPRGIGAAEIAARLGAGWELVSSEVDADVSRDPGDPIYVHELRRQQPAHT